MTLIFVFLFGFIRKFSGDVMGQNLRNGGNENYEMGKMGLGGGEGERESEEEAKRKGDGREDPGAGGGRREWVGGGRGSRGLKEEDDEVA